MRPERLITPVKDQLEASCTKPDSHQQVCRCPWRKSSIATTTRIMPTVSAILPQPLTIAAIATKAYPCSNQPERAWVDQNKNSSKLSRRIAIVNKRRYNIRWIISWSEIPKRFVSGIWATNVIWVLEINISQAQQNPVKISPTGIFLIRLSFDISNDWNHLKKTNAPIANGIQNVVITPAELHGKLYHHHAQPLRSCIARCSTAQTNSHKPYWIRPLTIYSTWQCNQCSHYPLVSLRTGSWLLLLLGRWSHAKRLSERLSQ